MKDNDELKNTSDDLDEFAERLSREGGQGLLHAAEKGDINLAGFKLSAWGADVNYAEETGYTALIIAAFENHGRFVSFMLDQGADPNMQTKSGTSALMAAVRNGNLEITRTLLEHGAKTGLKNVQGMTALHFAAAADKPEIIRELLKAGADKNVRDNIDVDQLTGKKPATELMTLEENDPDRKGLTPLDIAKLCGYKEAERILSDD